METMNFSYADVRISLKRLITVLEIKLMEYIFPLFCG